MSSTKTPVVAIVAALLPSLGIGAKGTLPWKLKQEMKYFRKVTSFTRSESKQNAVIMGRKTWESIPARFRPLPNRLNIILTRSTTNADDFGQGTIVAASLEDALTKVENSNIEKIYIIGGAEIYNSLMDDERLTHLLLTEIEHIGNTELPEMDRFLNFNNANGWLSNNTEELKQFIGDDSLEISEVEEGDYRYNYRMWSRK